MNHLLRVFFCVAALTVASWLNQSAVAQVPPPSAPMIAAPVNAPIDVRGGWASDRVIVRLSKDAVSCAQSHAGGGTTHTHSITLTPALNHLCDQWGVGAIEPAYPFAFGNHDLAVSLGLDRYFVLHVPRGTDTNGLVNALASSDPVVEHVELEQVGGIAALLPDDTDFALQYGLNNTGLRLKGVLGTGDADIDAPEAWELHTGDLGTVTIAIIDAGIFDHPEFAGRLVPGINTHEGEPADLTTDETNVGHGTHVAGIAAAKGNNGMGVAGVTWGAYLMPVRVTDRGGVGTAGEAAAGLMWAVDHGADVCNMSLQYCAPSPDDLAFLQSAIDYANARGALVIAAAGNNNLCGANTIAFPARLPGAIAVAATDNRDVHFASSNTGDELDVSAPGRDIWSTSNLKPDLYRYLSGTSMATPYVSGLAALLKSYAPYLSNDEIRDAIFSTVDDLGLPFLPGWDFKFGLGRINAFAALSAVRPPIDMMESSPPDLAIDARQPFNVDGSHPAGWDAVDLTFSASPAGLRPKDFTLEALPAGPVPTITQVTAVGNTVTLQLDGPIPLTSWTTITYLPTGAAVRLGYLPGDVDGNSLTNVDDVLALIDSLNGMGMPLPLWSVDLDRSGAARPADLIRLIDLLNGAGAFEVYNDARLPALP